MKKIIAMLLAVIMLMSVCAACGGKDDSAADAPAAPAAAAPDAAAPAAPAGEGEASGEPSGEASGPMEVEYYPSAGTDYDRDFEGYRQYCLDAFEKDTFAPDDIKEATVAEFSSMTEDSFQSGERWAALIGLGVMDDYDTFLASK